MEGLIISIGMGENLWIQYKKCNNSWYHWMRQKILSTVHNIIVHSTHCEYSKLNYKIGRELNISKQIKESDLWS